MNDTAAAILKATAALRDGTEKLRFEAPVHVTYNPLTYAWGPHEQYVRTYGNGEKSHLFLGMNPGPFGMAQTGVPFGEVDAVVNWLHIRGEVGRPEHTHPKRPVEGFGCPRSEVSGRRLWGLFAEAFGTAENFFRHNYVANYCPLIWRIPAKGTSKSLKKSFRARKEPSPPMMMSLSMLRSFRCS